MGRTVARLASSDPDLEIAGGVDRDGATDPSGTYRLLTSAAGCDRLLGAADVLVDFSAPAFLRSILEGRVESFPGPALVVGTTGLGEEEEALLVAIQSRVPVLKAANFSIGVNVLLAATEIVTRALGPEYDVEVVETHHRRKEDAPSGTALALGEAVAAGRGAELGVLRRDGRSGRVGARSPGEIGFHALRGGDVVGDHHLHFIGEMERLELVHRASDRALFAAGALRAAKWLAGREPGRYTMRDVLGL
jgi:4-hydroxy-tetrahydrodipicolinate reductase